MKSLALKLLPLLLALCFFNGCETPSVLSDLSITIVDFKPLNSSSSQALLKLRFANSNEAAAAVAGSSHKLYLNGNYIGHAATHEAIALPRLKDVTQTLTFEFENGASPQKLASMGSAESSYRLDSELFLEVDESKQKIKTSASGQVSLQAFGAMAASK